MSRDVLGVVVFSLVVLGLVVHTHNSQPLMRQDKKTGGHRDARSESYLKASASTLPIGYIPSTGS